MTKITDSTTKNWDLLRYSWAIHGNLMGYDMIWYVDQPSKPSIWYVGVSETAVYPTNCGHWYYPEKRWSLIKLWVHYLIGQTEPLFNLIHTESASFSFWQTSMIDPHSLRKQNPVAISQQPTAVTIFASGFSTLFFRACVAAVSSMLVNHTCDSGCDCSVSQFIYGLYGISVT